MNPAADFLFAPHDGYLLNGSRESFDGHGMPMCVLDDETESTATNVTKSYEDIPAPWHPGVDAGGLRLKVVHNGGGADGLVYIPTSHDVPASQIGQIEVTFYATGADLVSTGDVHPNMLTIGLLSDASGAENNGFSAAFAMRGRTGWNRIVLDRSHFNPFGTASWSHSTVRRLKVQVKQGVVTGPLTVHFAEIKYRRRSKAVFVHIMDDLRASQYALARPVFDRYGARGSLSVVGGMLDQTAGAPGGMFASISEDSMTLANLRTMLQDGWEGINHTQLHTSASGLSQAQVEAAFSAGAASMRKFDDGFRMRPEFWIWVGGAVSANAFAAASNLNAKLAFKTTEETYPNGTRHFVGHKYFLERRDMGSEKAGTAVTAELLRIAQAVQQGQPLFFMWHKFTDASSGTGLPDTLTNSVSWLTSILAAQREAVDAGLAQFLTVGEWYDGLDECHRTGGHKVA